MMHWFKSLAVATLMGLALPAFAGATPATLYKNPNCGCCGEYAKHLEANGFEVDLVETHDLNAIKEQYRIPQQLLACHTTVIRSHVFEGHVPAEDIKRVMSEQPMVRGLAVPGMPVGTPGMPGQQRGPIYVYHLQDRAQPEVFATH